MVWWLLACTDPTVETTPDVDDSESSPTATTGETGTPHTGGSATADTGTPPALPTLADVLDCEVPPPREKSDPPEPGDLHRLSLPTARCNDGSPVVAYLRAASDPDHAGDWVVQLDGGSFCGDAASCEARWCGDGAYNAKDMSSEWQPSHRSMGGIASHRPNNDFAGWNHVYLHYCTSDMWLGQRGDAVLELGGQVAGVPFEGALAVDELLDLVQAGASSDDGLVVLPSIDEAEQVLFAGQSAGGMGAASHLDAAAERLAPVPVVGLIDSLWTPDPVLVLAAGADDERFDPDYLDQWATARLAIRDTVVDLYGGRVDASCAAATTTLDCLDPGVLHRDHVSTAFLLHHSLIDPLLMLQHTAVGATPPAYAEASRQGLLELLEARPDVGVLGSVCGKHTIIGSSEWFQDMTVGTPPVSLNDAALAQVAGTPVQIVDDVTDPETVCP